jgi:hypothetical protein
MNARNELALAGGGLNRPTASERFTAEAWRLLTGERESSLRAVEAIRANPEALEEIRREWESLQAAVEPCGDAVVQTALTECATVYGSPWDDERLAAVGMAKYFAVLSSLPAEAVLRGFEDYDRQPDSRFFPRPGQLLALCEPHARKLRIAAGRARMARERLPSKAEKPKSPEERERERQALIDAGHMNPDGTFKPLQFKSAPPPPPSTPSVKSPRPLGAVLASDPHLRALKANPIPRGPETEAQPAPPPPAPPPSEFLG